MGIINQQILILFMCLPFSVLYDFEIVYRVNINLEIDHYENFASTLIDFSININHVKNLKNSILFED